MAKIEPIEIQLITCMKSSNETVGQLIEGVKLLRERVLVLERDKAAREQREIDNERMN